MKPATSNSSASGFVPCSPCGRPLTVENLLHADGEAYYFGKILSGKESHNYFKSLLRKVEWRNDEVIVFGKHITTKRMTAWYGDKDCAYKYSGILRTPSVWIRELAELKTIAEEHSGTNFNSCLLNLYHDGNEGMSWHSDDEKSLGKDIVIASLSFGANRRFIFKHRSSGTRKEVMLEDGSLLLMKGETQFFWKHSLPKSAKISEPRINLTFRNILS